MAGEEAKPLARSELTYTSCYCEENIYCLIRDHVPVENRRNYTVVFVSNLNRQTPLFYQRASLEPSSIPVTWDYHVFLLHHPSSSSVDVYDFDTSLSFPVGFERYYALAVRGDSAWADPEIDHARLKTYMCARPRWFRLVPAEEYVRVFASSRKHMVAQDGRWMAEPPEYPAIRNAVGEEDTLGEFLDFGVRGGGFGKVVDEEGFWEDFAGSSEEGGGK